MSQPNAANQVAKLLGNVGRWSVLLGLGGSALQASLYTGMSIWFESLQNTGNDLEVKLSNWSVTVDGGERAVMYDRIRGVLDKAVGEGTHFRVPWLQSPNVMDIRTRPRSIASVTGTKGKILLGLHEPHSSEETGRSTGSNHKQHLINASTCRSSDGQHHLESLVKARYTQSPSHLQGW